MKFLIIFVCCITSLQSINIKDFETIYQKKISAPINAYRGDLLKKIINKNSNNQLLHRTTTSGLFKFLQFEDKHIIADKRYSVKTIKSETGSLTTKISAVKWRQSQSSSSPNVNLTRKIFKLEAKQTESIMHRDSSLNSSIYSPTVSPTDSSSDSSIAEPNKPNVKNNIKGLNFVVGEIGGAVKDDVKGAKDEINVLGETARSSLISIPTNRSPSFATSPRVELNDNDDKFVDADDTNEKSTGRIFASEITVHKLNSGEVDFDKLEGGNETQINSLEEEERRLKNAAGFDGRQLLELLEIKNIGSDSKLNSKKYNETVQIENEFGKIFEEKKNDENNRREDHLIGQKVYENKIQFDLTIENEVPRSILGTDKWMDDYYSYAEVSGKHKETEKENEGNERGNRNCPPAPTQIPLSACGGSHCANNEQCQGQGEDTICCFNGCKKTCLSPVPPAPYVDWKKLPTGSFIIQDPSTIVESNVNWCNPLENYYQDEEPLLCPHGFFCKLSEHRDEEKRGTCEPITKSDLNENEVSVSE